jgi:hypothetical protein
MSTQPQPTFPSAVPATPVPIDVIAEMITTKGMFFVAPRATKEIPVAHSTYSEPTTNPSYPEGRIFWLETAYIFRDRQPHTDSVRGFGSLAELTATMETIAPLEAWQRFRGEPRSTAMS